MYLYDVQVSVVLRVHFGGLRFLFAQDLASRDAGVRANGFGATSFLRTCVRRCVG